MEFRGEKHRQIFQNYIRRQKHRPSAHHLAAVYLLTADKTLWKQVRGAFRDGKADLSAVHLCGIQPDAYALFRSAKELLTGEPMVGLAELSQSINYTFNLNRITLVRDISNLQKVGAMHYMETHGGCCTSEEYNNPQRAVEARELLERGNGILTDYGLLFINDEVPFEPVYNGVNFPEYWYEGMDKTGIELTYQDRKEYLYCPCEDESVEFALERLGADRVEQCGAEITCIPFGVKLGERVEGVLHNEGFHAFNAFCKRIKFLTTDEQDKLEAVVLYADATTSDELTRITDHLNDFVFAPGARDDEMLGRWWMEEKLGIDLPTELEDFFNYSGCGEYLAQESEGKFADGIGFVGMAEDCSLEDILPAQGQGMGGMTL